MSKRRIATSRKTVQSLLLVGCMLLPFLEINGNPAFRLDIGLRSLFLAGVVVRIDQLYLVLLSTLVLVAGFFLLTVVLGRVWCGWLCPQTVLNDLVDLLQDRLQRFFPGPIVRITSHLCVLLLAGLVSINLLSWFMPPVEVLNSLAALQSHPGVAVCFSFTSLLMYLNLIWVRRSFCRSYCPYGRFQAALQDKGTLNLTFLEETRESCIRCDSCVRVCPMDIDIRQGFQIECINCGRCIDACRTVMERLNGHDGLIAYRFGSGAGRGFRMGPKTVTLVVLLCSITAVLAWGIYTRTDTAFSVQRIATVDTRSLPDGSQIQAWRAIIGNRGQTPASFGLDIASIPGQKVELLGPVSSIRIDPNENRQVSFFIRISTPASLHQPLDLRLLKAGAPVSTVQVTP